MREDYSDTGDAGTIFPHDHARSRAYRWGEDGLLGITDRECRLCFALALWNGDDPILKERLFGLTGREGNHGEDVKEALFLSRCNADSLLPEGALQISPGRFPYDRLVEENRIAAAGEPEFELTDTGTFADNRYFDVSAEYAKAAPDDILIRLTLANRGPGPGDPPSAAHPLVPQHLVLGIRAQHLLHDYWATLGRPRRFRLVEAFYVTFETLFR